MRPPTPAEADHPRWAPPDHPDLSQYGYSPERAHRVEVRVENAAPIIWALTLLGAVIPAVALLLLVRWVAERIEPGYGTAAAITLGLGTIVMTFAAEYFSHVIAATLGFAAFALLFREREGPAEARPGRRRRPARRPGGQLRVPARARGGDPVRLRGWRARVACAARAAYAAGAVIGAAPALAFNLWALGSPLRFAYSYAVAVQGLTGHAELGLNSSGFFGIDLPRPGAALDLLLASRGLLTLTPVLVMGVVGAVMMRRRGRRGGGGRDRRGRDRVLPLQRRLLAAVRRRIARAALPDPGAALPRARPGARLQALPALTLGPGDSRRSPSCSPARSPSR